MNDIFLYEVENEGIEKVRGKLYKQITNLSVGNNKSIREDLFVETFDKVREYVIQVSAGTFVTKIGASHNIWHII